MAGLADGADRSLGRALKQAFIARLPNGDDRARPGNTTAYHRPLRRCWTSQLGTVDISDGFQYILALPYYYSTLVQTLKVLKTFRVLARHP